MLLKLLKALDIKGTIEELTKVNIVNFTLKLKLWSVIDICLSTFVRLSKMPWNIILAIDVTPVIPRETAYFDKLLE